MILQLKIFQFIMNLKLYYFNFENMRKFGMYFLFVTDNAKELKIYLSKEEFDKYFFKILGISEDFIFNCFDNWISSLEFKDIEKTILIWKYEDSLIINWKKDFSDLLNIDSVLYFDNKAIHEKIETNYKFIDDLTLSESEKILEDNKFNKINELKQESSFINIIHNENISFIKRQYAHELIKTSEEFYYVCYLLNQKKNIKTSISFRQNASYCIELLLKSILLYGGEFVKATHDIEELIQEVLNQKLIKNKEYISYLENENNRMVIDKLFNNAEDRRYNLLNINHFEFWFEIFENLIFVFKDTLRHLNYKEHPSLFLGTPHIESFSEDEINEKYNNIVNWNYKDFNWFKSKWLDEFNNLWRDKLFKKEFDLTLSDRINLCTWFTNCWIFQFNNSLCILEKYIRIWSPTYLWLILFTEIIEIWKYFIFLQKSDENIYWISYIRDFKIKWRNQTAERGFIKNNKFQIHETIKDLKEFFEKNTIDFNEKEINFYYPKINKELLDFFKNNNIAYKFNYK